jgi:hypothetical protein
MSEKKRSLGKIVIGETITLLAIAMALSLLSSRLKGQEMIRVRDLPIQDLCVQPQRVTRLIIDGRNATMIAGTFASLFDESLRNKSPISGVASIRSPRRRITSSVGSCRRRKPTRAQ